MPASTISSVSDPLTLSAKKTWEDPCVTVERTLEARAQGKPPVGGPVDGQLDRSFLGPLGTSGGVCG